MDEDLDGLPVFGADEDECAAERLTAQKDAPRDQSKRMNNSTSPMGHDADKSVRRSQMEEETSQNEGSDLGEGVREEALYSPLMKIKDEPIDEDYDKALIGSDQSDISRVKEELENGDPESSDPPEELRISSVFSVRGGADAIPAPPVAPQPPPFSAISQSPSVIRAPPIVLQAQMPPQIHAHLQLQPKTLAQLQPHLQAQLQAQLQNQLHLQAPLPAQFQHQLQAPPQPQLHPPAPLPPQAQTQPQLPPPAASIRICCSGCSKVLQKGQTAFQKKGSNQLFCSTMCLTGFTLPPAATITPKKTCHLCLKEIGNLKDLITVPIDSSNTLKEFCSLSCLSIYKSRVESIAKEVVRCAMCRSANEIQHEVTHQGILHQLCSDECFSRFRSTKRISMSCCESCGNCTVTGNYHLVQVEDTVKKFCSPSCISTFKQRSNKRVHCLSCQDFKSLDQMLEGTNTQGVIEFFCSARCVASSQASCTLSGASFPCTNCQKLAVPQYHLAVPDGSIRNFCSYECVGRFQERLHRSGQFNGGSYGIPNNAVRPPASHHPPASSALVSSHLPLALHVPAERPVILQECVRVSCKQCQKQFSSKPELLQYKSFVGVFCSRFCCDVYKREREVKAVCEYCKEEKVLKDVVLYEKRPKAFCCEGCKLLYKHDYAKQHGGQCRVCAYCFNVTHKALQNHFGGKLEEFCSEECMSLYTVLFYEMAKCHSCKNQGPLKENIRWDGTVRHFCNLPCLLQFCSKCVAPDQPSSNGITSAATSLSRDMPVIGGVVSLASALAGNDAVTGALPTSNASSKIIDDASTQTDAAVNGEAQPRRTMKNKSIMCKPIIEEQLVQCQLDLRNTLFDTVDENGEKVRLVPVPIPVPMPIYVPVPVHLYTQYTPVPVGLPLPIPVPMVVAGPRVVTRSVRAKSGVPPQNSIEEEEGEKSRSRAAAHADQSNSYSGDLESEARSAPFSWGQGEESTNNTKHSIRLPKPPKPRVTPRAAASKLLDLEKDFPLVSNDQETTKEQKLPPKRRKRGKKGRRRFVAEAAAGPFLSPSKLHHKYGVQAWSSWVQARAQKSDVSALALKEDVLGCSPEELSQALCHFISEVRRPNGRPYTPDSVYYLCLGLQQHLLENGRVENIFMDPLYNQFISDITQLLKGWTPTLNPSGVLQSRIGENILWECKQLGALSPLVLLNTLLFFGVKFLNLKSVEQHNRLSFSGTSFASRCERLYLRFWFPRTEQDDKEMRVLPGNKRKRDDTKESLECREMPGNSEDPLRCPFRLYEFYISKCPKSVMSSPDLFYLQPDSSCQPGSAIWYSAQPLEGDIMDSMLTRILLVQDVHLEPKQQEEEEQEQEIQQEEEEQQEQQQHQSSSDEDDALDAFRDTTAHD